MHRGDLLDDRVSALVAAGGVTRASLTRAMEEAALTDLRGEQLLPELLKVLRSQPVTDPALDAVVQKLDSWRAAGAQRKETSPGSHTYTHADAVRIMDAWWPKLVEAEFRPGLGDGLYTALTASLATDESPAASHGPSGRTADPRSSTAGGASPTRTCVRCSVSPSRARWRRRTAAGAT